MKRSEMKYGFNASLPFYEGEAIPAWLEAHIVGRGLTRRIRRCEPHFKEAKDGDDFIYRHKADR
jgi:hypothetical protein